MNSCQDKNTMVYMHIHIVLMQVKFNQVDISIIKVFANSLLYQLTILLKMNYTITNYLYMLLITTVHKQKMDIIAFYMQLVSDCPFIYSFIFLFIHLFFYLFIYLSIFCIHFCYGEMIVYNGTNIIKTRTNIIKTTRTNRTNGRRTLINRSLISTY